MLTKDFPHILQRDVITKNNPTITENGSKKCVIAKEKLKIAPPIKIMIPSAIGAAGKRDATRRARICFTVIYLFIIHLQNQI